MRKDFYILANLFFFMGLPLITTANHIVGGELRMKPTTGTNKNKITLLQFWDENNLTIPTKTTAGNRDATATLYTYKKSNNQFVDSVVVTYQSSENVTYQNKSCATARSMKTIQGIYTGQLTMSPQKYSDAGGYYMVWERCCRNGDINNIKEPGKTGMVFYLEFPPIATVDSSPEFQFPNGQYICINRRFTMNMSAVDYDGDELRYSLVTPMRGTTSGDPNMSVGNASTKAVYPLVQWESGISLSNVIPGPSPLEIGSSTGILTVVASQLGLYVFAIQCEEFRNGKRIGLVRRDFQLLVIDCGVDKPEPPVVVLDSKPVTDVKFCPERPISLETSSSTQWSYQWQLNGLNIAGATSAKIMVSDTGTYTVVKSYNAKCTADTSSLPIKVSYAEPVLANITFDKEILCFGDVATLTANSGDAIAVGRSYLWTNENNEVGRNKVQITAKNSGLYILKITDDVLGCTGLDSAWISKDTVKVVLPEKINLLKGSKVSVTAIASPRRNGYVYGWSPFDEGFKSDPSDSLAILGPIQNSNYTVSVTSPSGCQAEATVSVYVFENLRIPTAFSPDQNGVNDSFEIFNNKDQILDVRIFNRWGHVVFHSSGYEKPWNGNYKNEAVPAGAYPYIIKTTFGEYRGEVLLLK